MGRAERASRIRREREILAQLADIAKRAQTARAAITRLGLTLKSQHPFVQQIKKTEWLAAGAAIVPPGAAAATIRRVQDASLDAARLAGLLKALDSFLSRVVNAEQNVQWFKRNLDAFDKEGNEALDHLFEIEIAGLLARSEDVVVEMAEPDIVLNDRGSRVALACKRPKSFQAFDSAFRKAGDQIEESAFQRGIPLGVILLDVSLLMLPAKTGIDALVFSSPAEAARVYDSRIEEILGVANDRRANVLAKGIAGVLYTAYTVYVVGPAAELKDQRRSRRVWNSTVPGSGALLERLAALLA